MENWALYLGYTILKFPYISKDGYVTIGVATTNTFYNDMGDLYMTLGERLIQKIKDGTIQKDALSDTNEFDFHGGYEQLYFYKFSTYLGSVSRYILDMKLGDLPYIGEYYANDITRTYHGIYNLDMDCTFNCI